jgi:hypothetical protein
MNTCKNQSSPRSLQQAVGTIEDPEGPSHAPRTTSDSYQEAPDEQVAHFGDPKNSAVGFPQVRALPKSRSSSKSRSELTEPDYKSQRYQEAPKNLEAMLRLEFELIRTISKPLDRLKPRRTIDESSVSVRLHGTIIKPPNHIGSRRIFNDSLVQVRLNGTINQPPNHLRPRRTIDESLVNIKLR